MNATHLNPKQAKYFLKRLNDGEQQGLSYFYKILYPRLSSMAYKRLGDDVAANSIAQEAFLRLWLLHEKIDDPVKLKDFLLNQMKLGCESFRQKSSLSFHRNLIKLDDIENYLEFTAGYWPEEQLDLPNPAVLREKEQQWNEVNAILPGLPLNQQLFIKLCLQYSFSYEQIADHLGNISDREVARKVKQSIENLREKVRNIRKLTLITNAN
ncbi:sigma-70 family RNA polymerase sigma factor [Pedobacter sp. MC2016-14]|uniref:RNA polymerase sigma factor n=1 Tax=Pedobacter sp. MC2016-14 TaxID=2897327 RepID=UPI001E406323|nr:sigma-70 family RNA polymerase sigma factor [Pedobacter sp. MC2016-14]MCD0487738.1 sigma-70 family RNA polymerase sigma factor [Pedobacter sp. MC2016-14]